MIIFGTPCTKKEKGELRRRVTKKLEDGTCRNEEEGEAEQGRGCKADGGVMAEN